MLFGELNLFPSIPRVLLEIMGQEYERLVGLVSADAVDSPPFVKLIRGWISACDNQHACVESPEKPRETARNPTWVLDVHQKCIVPGAEARRYLTLSYVWPENTENAPEDGAHPVQLDQARLLYFQTPGVLEELCGPFPMVIQNAIELTRMIGERYLWVDRICIVQDADDAASEVMRMDQIYSGAYLNIISAGNHGLFTPSTTSDLSSECAAGLCTSNTSNRTGAYCSSAKDVNGQISWHYRDLSASKWATRGWTYQEQILSRRSIVFLDHGIFWECDQSVWDDHKLSPENDGPPTSEASEMGRRLSALRWPDFSLYIDLICLYNHRDFSHQQDALAAISGVLNVLGPVYTGDFIGGLPSTFLDCALLWQPFLKGAQRVALPKDLGGSDSDICLPSWSWCGWQCLVSPWSLRSGLCYTNTEKNQSLSGTWRTYNLVTWYTTTSSGNKRPVHEGSNLAEQVDKTSCGQTCQVPTRSSTQNGAETGSSNGSTAMPSYNEDASMSFNHILPKCESSVSHNINSASILLHCTTTRAFLRPAAVLQVSGCGITLGAPKISAFEHPIFTSIPERDQVTPIMVLQDMRGRRAGLLRLMHDEDDYDRLDQIELIAISTGSCSVPDMAECYEQQAFNGMVDWPGTTLMFDFSPTWIHKTFRSDDGSANDSPYLELPLSLLQGSVTYGIDDTVHFYNVLWIERQNGIAYRRACGRILKPIWEQNLHGSTAITLG